MTVFSTDTKMFSAALAALARVIQARPNVDCLAGVLIDARGDLLTLTGTDFSTVLRLTCPATVTEPGTALLSHRKVASFCSVVEQPSVEITASSAKAAITARHSRANIDRWDPTDYPEMPIGGEAIATIQPDLLLGAVALALSAVATDDLRPTLTGVSLTLGSAGLRAVGADGFRAHIASAPLADCGEHSLLLPGNGAKALGRFLDARGEAVVLSLSGTLVTFQQGSRVLATRTLEGTYPDITRVVPRETGRTITATADTWRQAIGIAAVFGTSDMLRIAIPFGNGPFAVGLSTADSSTEMTAALSAGEAAQLTLNHHYLSEAIAGAPGKTAVQLDYTAPTSPVRVTYSARGLDFLGVVMPMSVRD